MSNQSTEISVGFFIVLGFICLAYLSVSLGGIGLFQQDQYELTARFTSASGLKEGAYVEAAGVRVGIVKK